MRTHRPALAAILTLLGMALVPDADAAHLSGVGQPRQEWLLVQDHGRDDRRRYEVVPNPGHGGYALPPQHDGQAGIHAPPPVAHGLPVVPHQPSVILVPAPGGDAHHPR